jgi:hypothetical protein
LANPPTVIEKRNLWIHGAVVLAIAVGWLAILETHPDRDGFQGLSDGLLVFITAGLAFVYVVASSLAIVLLRNMRFGAIVVHGTCVVALGMASRLLFAVRAAP